MDSKTIHGLIKMWYVKAEKTHYGMYSDGEIVKVPFGDENCAIRKSKYTMRRDEKQLN